MEYNPISKLYSFETEEGDLIGIPAKFVVCNRCQGRGTHTNPSIDINGITSSEMEELGGDFERDYHNGFYDVTCEVCYGERVYPEPDTSLFSKEIQDQVEARLESEYLSYQERLSEERYGF